MIVNCFLWISVLYQRRIGITSKIWERARLSGEVGKADRIWGFCLEETPKQINPMGLKGL